MPGGYGSVKVHVKLGVPLPDKRIDEDAIKQARCAGWQHRVCADARADAVRAARHGAQVFPYGRVEKVEVVQGGLACCSGVMIPAMGDAEDAMLVVVAAVTVGN